MSTLRNNSLFRKGLMVMFAVMLMLGLTTAFAPATHAATNQTTVATKANTDVPAVEIKVYCGNNLGGFGIMDHVYVSGNNQHNVWSQWWGSSSDGYSATTWNFWWQGYTYIQWRLYGWQEHHAYYWISASNGNPLQVNVC